MKKLYNTNVLAVRAKFEKVESLLEEGRERQKNSFLSFFVCSILGIICVDVSPACFMRCNI
jgi:hypothetical protein